MLGWDEFDAFLALAHFLDSHSEHMKFVLKSKKKYAVFIESLIDKLCMDKEFRLRFMEYGGYVEVRIDEDGKVK